MRFSDKIDQIAPALVAAQKHGALVGKGGDNKAQHYRYAELLDFWIATKPIFDEHGVAVLTSVALEPLTGSLGDSYTTRNGGAQHIRHVSLTVRLVHSSGQWVEITMPGEGHDVGDKGVYKAITGARKYSIACLLNLVTSDDPENDAGLAKPLTNSDASTPGPAAGGKKPANQGALAAKAAGKSPKTGAAWSAEDAANLQAGLEERGLGFPDLVSAMADAGIRVPDRVSQWPEDLKPRVKAWLEKQPVLEQASDAVGGDEPRYESDGYDQSGPDDDCPI